MTRNKPHSERRGGKSGRRYEDQEIKVRLAVLENRQKDLESKVSGLREFVDIVSDKIHRNSKDILNAGHEIEKKVMDRIEKTTWQIILTFVGGISSLAIAMLIVWMEK